MTLMTNESIYFPIIYIKTNLGIIFQEPKTKSAKRRIAIPQFVLHELKRHK